MSTVQEIEAAIKQLPPAEVARVARWLAEYEAKLWDKQIEADAKSGKLDKVWKKAKQEIAAGKARPLDELLDNR